MVLDISDPAAPVLAGRYEIQGDTNDVTVSGNMHTYLFQIIPINLRMH